MDKLKDTSVIKFHSNTLQEVRKELGLDQAGMIDQSLLGVDQWLEKQQHIRKKDFSNEYKERMLISCKGSVERVKLKLDKMCTCRTLLPQFFDTFDVDIDYEPYRGQIIDAFLPRLTPNNERVIFIKNNGIKGNDLMGYYKRFVKIVEYMKQYDYSLGVHIVCDYTDMNIVEFASKLNLVELQHCVAILIDAFTMRMKSLRCITKSKFIELIMTVFKQVLSAKLGQRMFVHHSIEDMYDAFPKSMLPKEYGGDEKSLKELNDDLSKALTSEEFVSYLKEMSQAVTNEELRSKVSYNEQVMGMPGSFRKLAVD